MSIVASSVAGVKTPAPVEDDTFHTLVARTLEFARLSQGLTIEQAAGLACVPADDWQTWEAAKSVPTLDELGNLAACLSDPVDWPFRRFQLTHQEAADLTAGTLAWRLPYSGSVIEVRPEPADRLAGAEWVERHETR